MMKEKHHARSASRLGLIVTILLISLAAACFPPQAPAGPSIRAEDVWARPAQMMAGAMAGSNTQESGQAGMGSQQGMMAHGAAGNGAVYMVLHNDGRQPDRLIAAQADVADVIEIHETRMEGDVMKMQQVQGGIEVPAGGQVELKPGGYHVMLIGLRQDLKPGDSFPVSLQFEQSGTLALEAQVRQP